MEASGPATSLLGGLVLGVVLLGSAPTASADGADAQFLDGLSYLRDTGFNSEAYDRSKLVATGRMVCNLFGQGKDSPTATQAVVTALGMSSQRNSEYNATWIVKGPTSAYCP